MLASAATPIGQETRWQILQEELGSMPRRATSPEVEWFRVVALLPTKTIEKVTGNSICGQDRYGTPCYLVSGLIYVSVLYILFAASKKGG